MCFLVYKLDRSNDVHLKTGSVLGVDILAVPGRTDCPGRLAGSHQCIMSISKLILPSILIENGTVRKVQELNFPTLVPNQAAQEKKCTIYQRI